MSRQEFFNLVRDGYYKEQEVTLTEFCKMYSSVTPIFGVLKTEIEKLEDNTTKITFIDEDICDYCINSKGEEVDEVIDMSSISMVMYLDENNIINAVQHGMSMFTPANKDLALFCGSLIGKKIKL